MVPIPEVRREHARIDCCLHSPFTKIRVERDNASGTYFPIECMVRRGKRILLTVSAPEDDKGEMALVCRGFLTMDKELHVDGCHQIPHSCHYDAVGSIAANVADGFTMVAVGDLIATRP